MSNIRNTSTTYRLNYDFEPVRGGIKGSSVEIVRIEVVLYWEPREGWSMDADAYAWNLTKAGQRSFRQGGPRVIWNERFLVREYGVQAVADALLRSGLDPKVVRDDAQVERKWTLEWATS